MYKAIKIEIKLTEEQKIQVNKTIGVERFIYNEYIKYNQEQYKSIISLLVLLIFLSISIMYIFLIILIKNG